MAPDLVKLLKANKAWAGVRVRVRVRSRVRVRFRVRFRVRVKVRFRVRVKVRVRVRVMVRVRINARVELGIWVGIGTVGRLVYSCSKIRGTESYSDLNRSHRSTAASSHPY